MERACLAENKAQFSQSTWDGTHFTKQHVLRDFGYLAVGPKVQEVLRSEYRPAQDVDQYATKLLLALQMPEDVRAAAPVSMVVTTQDLITGWTNSQEYTCSGPSGYHFGHTKAVCQKQEMAEFEATMTNIPYAPGYLPQ